jgi:nicotinate-nucleotide adenylyltransferase
VKKIHHFDNLEHVCHELDRELVGVLSPERLGHTRRVAKTAIRLAIRHRISTDAAWLAGLAHDWAREWPAHLILGFLQGHGVVLAPEELEKPILAHGKVAVVLLRQHFGVSDPAIAEAIEHHTLGQAGMGYLARIIFVADYIEPGRSFTSPKFRRRVRQSCLSCMVRLVIQHNQERHGDLHSETKGLYDEVAATCTCPAAIILETGTA